MEQTIIGAENDYSQLDGWLRDSGAETVLLVCGKSIGRQAIGRYFEALPGRLGIRVVRFSAFAPNPGYESVREGVALFRREGCQGLIAVGGGSAIDVAKCIRLWACLPGDGADGAWLRQEGGGRDIPFLAMPTTAGTGSEATRFAVIYEQGEKQSVTDESLIPDAVLLDPGALKTLPEYQRKACMMDALCHAIESFWSVNSTEESREYSRRATEAVLRHMDGYLANTDEGNAGMLMAAHTAGRAINLAQTTAGHAMCYKITSLFGCAHGHAAALCDRVLYPWMTEHTALCRDPRGRAWLEGRLDDIGRAMGQKNAAQGAEKLGRIFDGLGLSVPGATEAQFAILRTSVNPVRMKNHPVTLDAAAIDALYRRILSEENSEG